MDDLDGHTASRSTNESSTYGRGVGGLLDNSVGNFGRAGHGSTPGKVKIKCNFHE